MALLYVLLAIGLNIIVGYAGLLDLGYVAFFALGAYGAALVHLRWGWSLAPGLTAGMLLALVVAAVFIKRRKSNRVRSDDSPKVPLIFASSVA